MCILLFFVTALLMLIVIVKGSTYLNVALLKYSVKHLNVKFEINDVSKM